MKNTKIFFYIQVFSLVLIMSLPVLTLAAPELGLGQISGQTQLPSWGVSQNGGTGSVVNLIIAVIKVLLAITGAIAVLFIIIGGFQIVTAGAIPDNLKKGKQTVLNAIIGLVIIILSYVIITVVANFVGSGGAGGGGGLPNPGIPSP